MTKKSDNSQNNSNVPELFNTANQDGDLSNEALGVVKNIPNMGAKIKANLGINMQDVAASDSVIVSVLVDDSGSIRFAGNTDIVIEGHNLIIESLRNAKQKNNILATTHYINGTVLYPYVLLDDAILLDKQNYNEDYFGGTPLYDKSVEFLATVFAKGKESEEDGTPARTITLIISDGEDVHSRSNNANDVKSLVKDMLMAENHIVAAMGIDNGETDFKKVFTEMGIEEKWILTPKNDPKEIRDAFKLFSQSAVSASQNAGSFSKTNSGGFGD